jgi:hypothetical protein
VKQEDTDRRKHQRIEVVKANFIEVGRRRSRSESENTIIRCETAEKGDGFWAGLELHDSNRQNMEAWFKVIYRLSSMPPAD